MHRIDTATAQKDKFGAGKNGFTRGNPQTGTPATDLDDDYFDMIQEELCRVVEESGAELDKAKHDQLLTALRSLLLSRSNPFGDIASDGQDAIATALSNLGLAEAGNTSGKLALIGNAKTDTNKCAVIVKTGSNANGKYRIWSDGSIDMWGNGIANVNGDALVNYPIAIPAAAQNVTTTPLVLSTGTNRPTTSVMLVTDLTTATKATFIVKRSDGTTSADGFYWSVNYAAF
ncbi:gp53-like domain-containing protein [Citrobacter farmeri]